ncbi:MAG: selenide, water dikinase SelD, partial [Saprospiraceae bacterium]
DILFLTKPLGVGILSTAQKKGLLKAEAEKIMVDTMCTLNKVGVELAQIAGVHAMTDVTGFGLLGHLLEMLRGSRLSATIDVSHIPLFPNINHYLEAGAYPGGTTRNWDSYSHEIRFNFNLPDQGATKQNEQWKLILSDPQTSGGLLIAVDPKDEQEVKNILKRNNLNEQPIGRLTPLASKFIVIS